MPLLPLLTFKSSLNVNLIERSLRYNLIGRGCEYEKLNSLFQAQGISHHVSCPHAHQQNGSTERKHRHIVEVGLALLANAHMPLKFWMKPFLQPHTS
jgi:hypothetical protein